MGESSQIGKICKLLEQILAQCEAEHTFKGTILEFDIVDPVPKERLAKGMLIDRKEGMRRVNFFPSIYDGSVVNASYLNVGNDVIILGKQDRLRETVTSPLLIMLPEKQTILIAKRPESYRWGAPGDTILTVLFCIGQS